MALGVTACTAIAGIAVVTLARWGPDWPAQEFRAWIAVHDGLSAWTPRWYGGSALPGYSVLYPPLAAVAGAAGIGLAAAVLAAWAASAFAPRARPRAIVYSVGVAANLVETLLIGQVPFLLGTAFGVLAFRAFVRGRSAWLVLLFAVLTSLATPLAGALLVLVLPACAASGGLRRALPLAGGLVGSVVALAVGGASGPFPMPWLLLVSMAGFAALVVALTPRGNRPLRVFAGCYLLAAVVLFLVPNPIGGNLARLGKLVALPLAAHYLGFDRFWLRARALVVAVAAMLWPTVPFVTSAVNGADDPSRTQQFYAGLVDYLSTQRFGAGRVEIPFTREHWETYWVAQHVPIARGWERQTDYLYNAVLYRPLTADAYRHWLTANAVHYVALPDVPIDDGGSAEAQLLAHPPGYLQPVWRDAHWQVWRVRHAAPLVTGAARLRHAGPSSLVIRFRHAGTAVVKVRYDSMWQADGVGSCVAPTPANWLEVRALHAGTVDLQASLSGRLFSATSDCQ